MSSNRKREPIRAIDNHEFEEFVRINLATDLANIILLTIGIRSYMVFLQFHDFNTELLNVYDIINEKDKLNLFLPANSTSTIRVKPAILQELKLFQDECRKQLDNNVNKQINSENSSSTHCENQSKKFKKGLNSSAIIFGDRSNDIEENSKLRYREKPINKENEPTDWSFSSDEASNYDAHSQAHGFVIPSIFNIKEVTHTYVTSQRINYFFKKNMQIDYQDIDKFIFFLQHNLAWHIENLYEFTMKIRTNNILYTQFVEHFRNYSSSKNNIGLKEKRQWLVDYIKITNYKPSGYGH